MAFLTIFTPIRNCLPLTQKRTSAALQDQDSTSSIAFQQSVPGGSRHFIIRGESGSHTRGDSQEM